MKDKKIEKFLSKAKKNLGQYACGAEKVIVDYVNKHGGIKKVAKKAVKYAAIIGVAGAVLSVAVAPTAVATAVNATAVGVVANATAANATAVAVAASSSRANEAAKIGGLLLAALIVSAHRKSC